MILSDTPYGKKRLITLPSLLFVFLLIYVSDATVFMRTLNGAIATFRKGFVVIGMLAGLFLFFARRMKMHRTEFYWLMIMSVGVFISGLINNENMNGIIVFISQSVFMFCVCRLFSCERFCKNYIFLMRIISVVSIVVYLIVQAYPLFSYNLPRMKTASSTELTTWDWGTLLFTNVPLNVSKSWTVRNFGPFWEPGAFATHLNLSLFIVLFIQKDNPRRMLDVMLFIFAITTTLSSGGIIATCALLATFVLSTDASRRNKGLKFAVIVLAGIAAYYLININTSFIELISERFDTSTYNGSFDSRFYSILGGLYVFFSNFFLGAGLTNVDSEISRFYVEIVGGVASTIHNTNTLINYFATGGVYMGVIQCIAWKRAMLRGRRIKGVVSILLLVSCFLMLSNEDMTRSMVFILFPLYALFDKRGESNE